MTYITNLGSEENIPGLDEELLKDAIRHHYRSEYLSVEKNRDPKARYLKKLFGVGGFAGIVAGAGLAFTFVASPLALTGAFGLAVAGISGLLTAEKMAFETKERAKRALENDLDSFALVKRFVTTVLTGQQAGLDSEEKRREREYADFRRRIAQDRKDLARVRKAAVSLIAKGLDRFESEAKESLDEITALKKEAASFAAEFGGVAEKVTAKPDVPTARQYTSAHRSDVGLGP